MGRLKEFIDAGRNLIITGPYGTATAERVARDMVEHPQKATGVTFNKYLGAGCSALLSDSGRQYLEEIASDYLNHVPVKQDVVLVTPSFRLEKQILESAGEAGGFDTKLERKGLELCLRAMRVAENVLVNSKRSLNNTLIAMSIGPPFDCYKGEDTPKDIDNKYKPQVFAAVRFGVSLDYLMFETVPSLQAAIGAARAFKQAHSEYNLEERRENYKAGTVKYLGDMIDHAELIDSTGEALARFAPSYDRKTKTFEEIQPEKDYVISLCLEADGTLNGRNLDEAITELYQTIEQEGLYMPAGLGINCNSPKVTLAALRSLSAENSARFISMHPNASSVDNPREYCTMSRETAIPQDEYVGLLKQIKTEFPSIKIVGGCCGTNEHTMTKIYDAQKATGK